MMDGGEITWVLIALIIGWVSVVKMHYKAKHGIIEDAKGNQMLAKPAASDPALEAEIKRLNERIAVLEKITVDERQPRALAHEIEKLRD